MLQEFISEDKGEKRALNLAQLQEYEISPPFKMNEFYSENFFIKVCTENCRNEIPEIILSDSDLFFSSRKDRRTTNIKKKRQREEEEEEGSWLLFSK